MLYKTIVRVAATTEPVTLSEAKAQLRVDDDFTLDDDLINALIMGARDRVENYCNRFFTTQQVTVIYEGALPLGDIRLPYPDLASVESVQYTDSDNALQTVDPGDYAVNLDEQYISPVTSWEGGAKSYRVNMTTGAPVSLDPVKQAILMIVADLYETRTESVLGVTVANNPAVVALLYPYRVNLGI